MERLTQCCEARGCQIVDADSGQTLRLTIPNHWECQAYRFEPRHFWPGDKSPDGLLLIRTPDNKSFVCFIELKSGKKPDWSEARKQLEMGVSHFAPLHHHPFLQQEKGQKLQRKGLFSHGDRHHERWRNGSDFLPLNISRDHQVICLVITQRSIGRASPHHFNPGRPLFVCQKPIRFVMVQVARSIAIDQLLSKASVYAPSQ